MVIDTSAFAAIFTNEPERRGFIESIEAASVRLVPAATFVETSIVLESRYGPEGVRDFDLFLNKAAAEIVLVTPNRPRRRGWPSAGSGRGVIARR